MDTANGVDMVNAMDTSDGVDTTHVIAKETRNVFRDMLDNIKRIVGTISKPMQALSLVVQYLKYHIYKSTLVSQLNRNPFLSKDRLTRMKNSIYFNNSDGYVRAANCANTQLLGLGSDCAIYFMQRNSTMRSSTVKAWENKNEVWL